MNWYHISGGQQYGPIDDAELYQRAQDGRLRPTDLVWNETMGAQWTNASNIPGLFPPGYRGIPYGRPAGTGGTTPNAELMARARVGLKGNWGLAVGVMLVYGIIIQAVGMVPYIGGIGALIIEGPFTLGLAIFFLCISRRTKAEFSQLFAGFQSFGTALGAYLLMAIFIFLWSLLLIIPGIIAGYAYSMTFYIMADDPNAGPLEAIRKSKEMMRGKKGKLFCLHLRFIGWWFLCILSCFIGFLWLGPYIQAATAQFYDDLAPAPAAGPQQNLRMSGGTQITTL